MEENENIFFGKVLMFFIVYSVLIGGMVILIGIFLNLVLVGVVVELYGVEISFV